MKKKKSKNGMMMESLALFVMEILEILSSIVIVAVVEEMNLIQMIVVETLEIELQMMLVLVDQMRMGILEQNCFRIRIVRPL